jgi:hypothetical protein
MLSLVEDAKATLKQTTAQLEALNREMLTLESQRLSVQRFEKISSELHNLGYSLNETSPDSLGQLTDRQKSSSSMHERPRNEAQRWCTLRTKRTTKKSRKDCWGKGLKCRPLPLTPYPARRCKDAIRKRKLCPKNLCHLRGSPHYLVNLLGTSGSRGRSCSLRTPGFRGARSSHRSGANGRESTRTGPAGHAA